MNYQSRIIITKDVHSLYACFKPLLSREMSDRALVKMRKIKKAKALSFTIQAKDPVSFRAGMNMITQSLSIYERMKNLTNGSRKTTTIAAS